jgi:hypothetical protein
MGRETASGEVLHTEGTMREDRRPDFRPTSKCNKAFTPLRTTSFVPYGRLSFPFFIWVVFFFSLFLISIFFFFFFTFGVASSSWDRVDYSRQKFNGYALYII